ncbi:MAG TPA: Rpn family recombination-promoting nuclease/putative transposase [Kofleriaceae bacterium]|nr:Rpn family recombination-promoting nuclease/putative transposase [Kofleriaceae bacterium]
MTSTTPTPHDALFKGLLGKPEHARGVLRGVVPATVAEAIDWQTLTPVPGNFVDLELRQQYTDLLFSARWHDGSELLAFFLFEHQSAPPKVKDGPMVFRLLRYQVRIWEEWFSRNPEAKALPMIIPVVMYHGQAPWSEPRLFGDVLAVPPAVRSVVKRYLVQFAYLLNDLSEISDDELRARAMTAVAKLVALCFKHARTSPDFMTILGRWMGVVREVVQAPNGLSALAQVLCYILQVSEHVEREALKALLAREIGPETEEAIVTAGQLLIEQGVKQGIEQGVKQGIKQGFQQGERAALLRLLRHRFGDEVDNYVEERVATAPIERIETWTIRVLSAATLADLFAN